MKELFRIAAIFFAVWMSGQVAFANCPECEEVAKGKIPSKFLDMSVKALPSGIAVWDNPEAIAALKDKERKTLWVDTRPSSFLKIGTIKNAVNLVCDLKGVPIPEADKAKEFTKEKLFSEIGKMDPDPGAVTVVFFCQGPKCHRSYNAALRSVSEFNLAPENIVWYRAGYPNLEKEVLATPKLKRRISKYLQGDVVNQ